MFFEREGHKGSKEIFVRSPIHHFPFGAMCIPYRNYKCCKRKYLVYVVVLTPEIYILYLIFNICQLIL